MKYSADISMASMTNRSDQKTSNMLNDELLRLDRSAVATITPGTMTLSEHVSNKAFSDMSSDMMF